MINDAQVSLAGHVANTPSFKELANGVPRTTVRVACTPRWLNRETGEWSDGQTSFVNVLCWRTLATNVAVCLRRGEPVLVMGRLRVRRYPDKDGVLRTAVEVEANSIGHDLTRGVAHFTRLPGRPAGQVAGLGAQSTADDAAPAAPAEAAGEVGPGAPAVPGPPPAAETGAEVPPSTGPHPEEDQPGITVAGPAVGPADPPEGERMLDEHAVAELAREMSESLSEVSAGF